MAKIIHLLNKNQKIKIEIILEALLNLRTEYSKDNMHTDEMIEINRIIREIGELDLATHVLN